MIDTPEFWPEKFSATSEEMGWTVEEPDTTTFPVTPLLPPLPLFPELLLHAAATIDKAATAATTPGLPILLTMPPLERGGW